MANKRGVHDKFKPTLAQRKLVRYLKALNTKEELIRLIVLNPSNRNKPISKDTFSKAFEKELLTAKVTLISKAASNLFSDLESKDPRIRRESSLKVLQLCSKGVFEPKFKLDTNAGSMDQLRSVMQAFSDGLLHSYEAETLIKGIDSKVKADEGTGGHITVTIDQPSHDDLQNVIDENGQ